MTESKWRRLMAVPDLKTTTCPGCGAEPALAIGYAQWFCEDEDCPVWIWNPLMTREEQLTAVRIIKLARDL